MLKIRYVFFFSFLLIIGCTEKFNKKTWAERDRASMESRELMAEDLLKTHQLIGLSRKQLFQLLGPSEDSTQTFYILTEKYDMIDPVSGKDLVIKYSEDSIVTSVQIKEWHK